MKKNNPIKSFSSYSFQLIVELKEQNRFGTAQAYEKVCRSFKSFLSTFFASSSDISMDMITPEVIQDYNRYLRERNVVRNTISFYNRVLRAMYNKSLREYHFNDTKPFVGSYTGIDKTVGRAVSEQAVAIVAMLDVDNDSSLALARDMFVFSYAMRGMPFVDMAYMKKSQIKDGIVTYNRRKTGGTIRVRVEDEIKTIIDRYSRQTEDSEYLFPVLCHKSSSKKENTPLSDEQVYSRYRSGLAAYNRNLKRLANLAGIEENLSSYVARHSWATAARGIGSGIPVISEALGHTSERMTRIYIGSLDSSLVDSTNRRILDRFDRFCSPFEVRSKHFKHNKNARKRFRAKNMYVSMKETINTQIYGLYRKYTTLFR